MANVVDTHQASDAPPEPVARRPLPRWVITTISVAVALVIWEIVGRNINPIFFSYPSAIAVAFWHLTVSGQLWGALS
ncbi:MAG TPA: hypothetical protein VE224_05085, partial [Pseudolabrys sp.]|nr:hypothetical protein [Pseudolabrys sp.]